MKMKDLIEFLKIGGWVVAIGLSIWIIVIKQNEPNKIPSNINVDSGFGAPDTVYKAGKTILDTIYIPTEMLTEPIIEGNNNYVMVEEDPVVLIDTSGTIQVIEHVTPIIFKRELLVSEKTFDLKWSTETVKVTSHVKPLDISLDVRYKFEDAQVEDGFTKFLKRGLWTASLFGTIHLFNESQNGNFHVDDALLAGVVSAGFYYSF